MEYIAAIDIGSNAIRLAIARLRDNTVYISYRSREPVRLGSSVFSKGQIDTEIYEQLKQAIIQFSNQMKNHNVSRYRAIATSAMREAENGAEVVEKLFSETGIKVEIISGEEEARLVSNAIAQKIDTNSGEHLLIDIGGGSIELVAVSQGKILKKESFVLGMVRVLELQKSQKEDLAEWFPQMIIDKVSHFFKDLPPMTSAVGTGGNMDRFIKLKDFVSKDPGEYLTLDEMEDLFNQLSSHSYKERIVKFYLKPDRADVIIPAAIATLELMDLGKCQKIHFPQVGLKDGVLHELSSGSEN